MKQVKKSKLPYVNFKIIYTIGSYFKTNYISFTDDNLLYRIGYKYDDDENDSIPNIGKIKKGKKRILILNNASRYTFDCSLKCNYDNELCFEFLYGYEFTIQVEKVKTCKKKHIIDETKNYAIDKKNGLIFNKGRHARRLLKSLKKNNFDDKIKQLCLDLTKVEVIDSDYTEESNYCNDGDDYCYDSYSVYDICIAYGVIKL
jgi:hypothetical protein